MGRNKKSKGKDVNSKPLTHDEIWDDSALLDSWDAAYEEYKVTSPSLLSVYGSSEEFRELITLHKKYHSLHARGESVLDVLQAAEAEEFIEGDERGEESGAFVGGAEVGADIDDAGAHAGAAAAMASMAQDTREEDEDMREAAETLASAGQQPEPGTAAAQDTQGSLDASAFPRNMLSIGPESNTHGDEALKNLMMSWYWAGYYTGYYEGQRDGQQGQVGATNSGSGAA